MDSFIGLTQDLFTTVAVIYSTLFHDPTLFKQVKNAGPEVFRYDSDLHATYQRAWRALPDFRAK